jgi:hypothetical protein
MKKLSIFGFIITTLLTTHLANACIDHFSLPPSWSMLKPILTKRVIQTSPKMKLTNEQAASFVHFLEQLDTPLPELLHLQSILPKTTLELLIAVHTRGVALEEAEKMTSYLYLLVEKFNFENHKAFDENTSHIIGREWHEIDYSGEYMTWQKQKLKYLPYGILNFKSLESLTKFFLIESKLPYFRKIYRPRSLG